MELGLEDRNNCQLSTGTKVSILVVMELGLEDFGALFFYPFCFSVSILVVMELGLEE